MKTTYTIAKGIVLGAALIALATLTSCVASTTTTTSPDGTVSVTKNTAPDANSLLSLNILTETWGNTRGVNRNSGK